MNSLIAIAVVGGTCTMGVAGIADWRGHALTHVDVSGAESFGPFGDPLNTVIGLSGDFVSQYVELSAIGWDLDVQTNDLTWLSELRIRVSNNLGDFVEFQPGAGDDFSGFGTYTTDGVMSLVDSGDSFFVGDDHTLRVEFFNLYGVPGPDPGFLHTQLLEGSVFTIGTRVPAPGTAVLCCLPIGFGLMNRRRSCGIH